MNAKYIKRRIKELQRDLQHLREDERKQYWRDYYILHKDKKIAYAKARYRRLKNEQLHVP